MKEHRAVLQWLILCVGGLHSVADKEPSILGSFSFVRFKFQSGGSAFSPQNVRLVTSDKQLSFPSPTRADNFIQLLERPNNFQVISKNATMSQTKRSPDMNYSDNRCCLLMWPLGGLIMSVNTSCWPAWS